MGLIAVVAMVLHVSIGIAAAQATNPTSCAATVASMSGDSRLNVVLGWPNGEVVFKPGGPGFITGNGALGMKFPWNRGVRGRLTIEGRRLDGDAPPLRSEVHNGYGDIGFQASYVIFPTPGCWEVTGRVADASVTFIARVVKVGDGPSWRRGR